MATDRLHKAQAEYVYDFLGLLCRFVVQLYVCLVPRLYMIYFILPWHDIAESIIITTINKIKHYGGIT